MATGDNQRTDDDSNLLTAKKWMSDDWNDAHWDEQSRIYSVEFTTRDTAKLLITYMPPLLLFMGTIGNVLTAILLWRFHRKVLSTCLYIFVATVVELCALYIRCGNDWLMVLSQIDVKYIAMHSSNSVCKIYPFVSDLTLHLATWMTVAMATETAIVTLRPQRLMRFCRVERARSVILLLVVLLICLNAHCFWTWALIKEERAAQITTTCTTSRRGNQHSEDFRRVAWPVIDILVADFFPLFVIFSCIVIVITKRIKKKEHLRVLENSWKSYSVDAVTARELQDSFIGICIIHFILLLPKLGYEIYEFLVEPDALALFEYTVLGDSRRILAKTLCYLLMYAYQSCKFFIFLGMCKAFRTGVWTMLTCSSCSPRHVDTRTPRGPPPASPHKSRVIANDYEREPVPVPQIPLSSPHHTPLLSENLVPDNYTAPTIVMGNFDAYPNDTNISPRRQFSMTAV